VETILVIDDDEAVRKLLKDFLQKENYIVETAKNGRNAVDMLSDAPEAYHLIVLDLMLPDFSGIDACKQIRKFSEIPVIILSGKSADSDKIAGFEAGADDYMTKPFNPKELTARIKAIMHRCQPAGAKTKNGAVLPNLPEEKIRIAYRITPREIKLPEKIFHKEIKLTLPSITKKKKEDSAMLKKIEISPNSRKVWLDSKEVKLTNKEYNILVHFYENKNMVLSRENLLEKIWGYDFIGESRTIDVHIKELRKKIGDIKGNLIETIWSVGYRLNYDEALNRLPEE